MELLIFTSEITKRKKYIFRHIFDELLGVNFSFTSDFNLFEGYSGPKISYSKNTLKGEVHFEESFLLSSDIINEFDKDNVVYKDYKIPFAVENSLFPFDVFAASFYFISRYEEYLPFEGDEFDRFKGANSYAFKHNFLDKPVIDEWALEILKTLLINFPELQYKKRAFKFIPTLDIDLPYYILNQKIGRRILKTIKLLLKGDFGTFSKDPYDVYEEVDNWDKRFGVKTTYFFLMGDESPLDAHHDVNHPKFKKLIGKISKQHFVGIHPSFVSNSDFNLIKKEKQRLESILNKSIEISRQHYLKLALPETYLQLQNVGIKEDYTLVFADKVGFRASTCSPFLWYNLKEEKETDLVIYPTAVMDQTLKKYLNLNVDESISVIKKLMYRVKAVNGTFISLWHNESVSDFGQWKNWKAVYLEMLRLSQTKDN